MENNEVQFDEPQYRIPTQQAQQNLFVDFLIKKGWAKDKQQATYILFGIIGVSIIISVWGFTRDGKQPYTGIDILPQESVGSEQGR